MAVRLSGLVSNMDTDSIIKELMKAQSLKKTKVENKITTTEWKQEKWKTLNAKIYALYTGSINKMRFQGSFETKSVSSSDESKVSVTTSSNAVVGSHTIQVNELASAQYITSSKLADNVTATTKLTELDPSLLPNASGETKINFSTADKSFSLTITDKTTINDFVNAANSAGIKASYDSTQKRIFLSSGESGVEKSYSITTSTTTASELTAKNSIRNLVGYSNLASSAQATVDNAIDQYNVVSQKLTTATGDEKTKLEAELETAKTTIYTYTQNKVTQDLRSSYTSNSVSAALATRYGVRTYDVVVQEAKDYYNNNLGEKTYSADDEQKAVDAAIAAEATKYATSVKNEFVASAPADNPYIIATQNVNTAMTSKFPVAIATDDIVNGGTNKLANLGLSTVKAIIDPVADTVTYETSDISKITLIEASNSEVLYNGAKLTGTTNTITANGLTFDVHTVTKDLANPNVTLTVAKDTQGVYDTVKTFVKEYNELLKEMNSLYYADSSRGYDPLSDEEKEAMSEGQIDRWETKIKDSLLRRDNKLGSLLSTMKTTLMGSVEHEGKSYALSTFGIGTSLYTEKGLLHIDGDQDDSTVAMSKDKLKVALEENPEAVMTTITTLVGNLYSEMTEKMKTSSLNSALSFYNDKELASNLKSYKTDLKTLESRLKTVEEKYYKQFSAMEAAMSKLNSQSSSLASLIGSN